MGQRGTVRVGIMIFSTGKEMKIINWEQVFFVQHRTVSAVKRVELVSDRLSYIMLRGRWCNIIVVNAHAPSKEKSDESKDSFYEELEQVFDHFPKYHMKMLLGDLMQKWGKRKFSSQQLDRRVFNSIVMIMGLD